MGFTATLLTAASEYLHAENVGAWNPVGGYRPDDVAITHTRFHPSIDRAIAMSTYPVSDDATTDSVVGLQLWIRGVAARAAKPPLPAISAQEASVSAPNIADRAFDALHELERVDWGGIPIVRIWRQSQTSHGPDANGREELSANYYIQLTRTGTHRRD
ncbi:hypothetical protein [Arthrobacter pityocampae]|uniref:hypothetical protein n=1 Tax=Arthrobacter pityocampae TaxID=547334 RepID=UPI003734F6AE